MDVVATVSTVINMEEAPGCSSQASMDISLADILASVKLGVFIEYSAQEFLLERTKYKH